jgi:hypothetical protein
MRIADDVAHDLVPGVGRDRGGQTRLPQHRADQRLGPAGQPTVRRQLAPLEQVAGVAGDLAWVAAGETTILHPSILELWLA